MYMGKSRFGSARASYQNIDLSSRIEGASPHKLVAILFDEVLKTLDAMAAAAERGDKGQVASRQARALSILGGLEGSLDMERGGEIAQSLASIYREARRLTLNAGRECDAEQVVHVRAMLHDIATAWEAIG